SKTETTLLYEGGQPNNILIKFSPEGEELWKRSYDDSYSIESIHLHSDGSIYLTAARWSSNPSLLRKLLIKTDGEGNELWRYNHGNFAESSISFVTEDENGNLIVAGDWSIGYIDVDSWYEKWFHIMRIENSNEAFNLIEERMYGYSIDGTLVYGLDKTQDGGYIGWGRTGVLDYSVEPWVPGAVPVKRGYIIKLDENLDSLWMRTYWKHDPNDGSQTGHAYQFGDVQELEEGGFVAAGWARRMVQGQGIREDSWICRIDEYGCIEPGCHLVNVEEIVIGLENTMSAFPNPASDVVTIQFTNPEGSSLNDLLQNGEIILFDIQGREVYRTNTRSAGFGLTPTPLQGRGAHSITLDISHLPAGLYSAQWVSGKQWLDSTKILVTND
ncbi:MAG: T9SS type A sorting domain-containing protein, partial [bacterium]